ncbi:MAG: TAT-variant-translocated molybdopterin oxidoreductase [Bryobacteraceae bacterium]|nr:TAT-variant-translocated molybdopterin oxidoreductase [Bryobacteraceae bacterium]
MPSMIQITKKLTGRKYWRSLDQLCQTSEFQEWVNREFPATGEEMIDEPSRRNILKVMAASFGLAGLTACRRPVEHILPHARGVEDQILGRPLFYNTAMTIGGASQGLMVEVNDGRPTKIEGNPEHPSSLGRARAWHQASVLQMYDPDRGIAFRSDGKNSSWEQFRTFATNLQGQFGNGAGLRFLTEHIDSPSLNALKKHALTRFPGAKWVEYNPVLSNETALPAVPRIHFDKASIIVSLDSDFLGLDTSTVLPVKEFARGRMTGDGDALQMNRLYVVESQFSVTGASADHRFRAKSADIGQYANALLAAIGNQSSLLKVVGQTPGSDKAIGIIAKDLLANRGKSVVVAGPRQPAGVHAVVHQINQALGNIGTVVSYLPRTSDQARPQVDSLKELTGEMAAGTVNTLIVLSWNPVYTAPADLDFAANLKKVSNVVYLASEEDETAKVAKWVIPAAYYLESWGDALSPDGTATIQQPTVEPLYNGKTAAEVVAALTGFKDLSAYDIVKNYWMGQLKDEKGWRKALHDGFVATASVNSASTVPAPDFASWAKPSADAASEFEVVFVPSWSTYDGRFNNNAWLQEVPDPITKISWDNAALVSTGTAKKLNLENGDVIFIERNGRKVEAPAFVQPGQADDSITVSLGYGRAHVGRVGEGTGFNGYSIRTSDTLGFGSGFKVSKTGRKYALVQTQEYASQQEPQLVGFQQSVIRPLVRETTVAKIKEEPDVIGEMAEVPPLRSLYGEYDYSRGQQWAMVIDLNSCIGCNACTVACQAENNIPVVGKEQVGRGREMHWIRLDRYYSGAPEDPQAITAPITCMQCETAPCENVCPVAATVHSPEGLNEMVYNRCVGTRYCSNNCPYKVRRFNFLNWHEDVRETEKMQWNPQVTVRMRGIMEKCTYCVQRIQRAKIDGRVQGKRWLNDGDVVPACAQTCPSDSIVFGNVNDLKSKVAQLKQSPRNYAMLAELNTKPRTTYLAKLRNPNPELEVRS